MANWDNACRIDDGYYDESSISYEELEEIEDTMAEKQFEEDRADEDYEYEYEFEVIA